MLCGLVGRVLNTDHMRTLIHPDVKAPERSTLLPSR